MRVPLQKIFFAAALLLAGVGPLSASEKASPKNPPAPPSLLSKSSDYLLLADQPWLTVNLKYATTDNFMGENLYGDFKQCYLHREAAAKLMAAGQYLQELRPGCKVMVFDCLRPRSIQWKLWNRVKGTDQEPYVADPQKGSSHNFGFAVDLTLVDEKGQELDMGTAYDAFTPLSEPQLEEKFLKEGKLTPKHLENRLLLRKVMEKAGFLQLPNEWWHFDALPKEEVRKKYKIVE